MGWLTIGTLVVIAFLLMVAAAVDVMDRRNGRDPKRRVESARSRNERRRTVKATMQGRRLGIGSLDAQFQPPPDDRDMRPDLRRPR